MGKFNWYNKKLKILNFTHVDLDGAASNIVIRNFFKDVITYTVNYDRDKEIIARIKQHYNEIDGIIFTDYTPSNLSQVQSMGKPVLVLDHHESALKMKDPNNDVYIVTSHCGAYVTYKYFNKFEELIHLQELVEITNDYDLFILKNIKSKPFNALFWKMGFEWFVERFLNGNVSLYEEEKTYIKTYMADYKKYYNSLEIVPLANKGVFCTVTKYLSDVSISLKDDGFQYLIIYHNGQFSLRSSNNKINLVNVCNRIGRGGGHPLACGIRLENDNVMTLINKIVKEIEVELNV